MNKQALRTEMRARRQALSAAQQRQAAEAVAGHLPALERWCAGARIAAYAASDCELDTAPLLARALRDNLTVYLPCLDEPGSLVFRRFTADQPLQKNRYGIAEPAPTAAACDVADLDIVFLPVVAFDGLGSRLGMGAGYYDRTLATARPGLLVGLAYDFQCVPRLPRDRWDVPAERVVTQSGIIHCPRR